MARRLERGDVVLLRFAAPQKERPVVVLTRGRFIPFLSRVTVAPLTSTIRGVPTEVQVDESDGMKAACVINLHNVVTVEKRALGRWVATLGPARMSQVCEALRFALACE